MDPLRWLAGTWKVRSNKYNLTTRNKDKSIKNFNLKTKVNELPKKSQTYQGAFTVKSSPWLFIINMDGCMTEIKATANSRAKLKLRSAGQSLVASLFAD